MYIIATNTEYMFKSHQFIYHGPQMKRPSTTLRIIIRAANRKRNKLTHKTKRSVDSKKLSCRCEFAHLDRVSVLYPGD